MTLSELLKSGLVASAALAVMTSVAGAAPPNCDVDPTHPSCKDDGGGDGGGNDGGNGGGGDPATYGWMHGDVGLAFDPNFLGGSFTGIGSHLIIVDDYDGSKINGNLTGNKQRLTHGDWTSLEASLVAPDAGLSMVDHQDHASSEVSSFYAATTVLNAVNLSFGLLDPAGTDVTAPEYSLGTPLWDSLVDEAWAGTAVFAKAAGNTSGGAVDDTFRYGFPFSSEYQDSLNLLLIDAPGALFVGALDGNSVLAADGSVIEQASIASYSTIAGSNLDIQNMFLVVGVDASENGGLEGTSFAAPIVAGYAALLGHKFSSATPVQVVDQLLETARHDTVLGYDVAIHGQGEACLSCALSPSSIPQ